MEPGAERVWKGFTHGKGTNKIRQNDQRQTEKLEANTPNNLDLDWTDPYGSCEICRSSVGSPISEKLDPSCHRWQVSFSLARQRKENSCSLCQHVSAVDVSGLCRPGSLRLRTAPPHRGPTCCQRMHRNPQRISWAWWYCSLEERNQGNQG